MNYADVQKLYDAGLITGEQRQNIIAHFQLKEDGGNKFLAIVSIDVGGKFFQFTPARRIE
jgi:hypothetical protein